jgi:hypothetical protein
MLLWDDSTEAIRLLLEELNHNIFGTPTTTSQSDSALITVRVTTNQLQALRRILANEPTSADDSVTTPADANLDGVRETNPVARVSESNSIVNAIQVHRSPISRLRPHHHSAIPIPVSSPSSTPRRISGRRSKVASPASVTHSPSSDASQTTPRRDQQRNQARNFRPRKDTLAIDQVESEAEVQATPLRHIRDKNRWKQKTSKATLSKSKDRQARPVFTSTNRRQSARQQAL